MKRNRIPALALALVLVLSCAACGTAEDAPETSDVIDDRPTVDSADNLFAINYSSSAAMNPYTTDNILNQVAGELIYEQLIELDDTFHAQPKLITAWSSEDGVTWTFTVDTSRVFHDGHYLTAEDVAYSITSAQESALYASRLRNITSVTAEEDGVTVTVTLNRANTQFPLLLSIPCIENNAMSYTYPSGTGPFYYGDDYTYLVLNQGHPDAGSIPVDTIYLREYDSMEEVINAFDSGALDLVCNDPTSETDLSFSSVSESRQYNTTNLQYIGFNTNRNFCSHPEYRRALATAVDRAYAVSLLGDAGVATALPVHPMSDLFDEQLGTSLAYDMGVTSTALTNAKVVDYDGDGEREYLASETSAEATDLSLTLLVCSDSTQKTAVANKMAADLRQIGVNVEVKGLPWEEYLEALAAGNFDLYYGELRLTADFDLTPVLVTGGSVNYGGASNADIESAITAYLAADDDHRMEACYELLTLVADNAPIVPVCFEKHEVCARRGVVGGFTPTQYNIFHDLASWTIDLN